MVERQDIVPVAEVGRKILLIRGQKVIVDSDLAQFYGVATKRLNEQLKRNKDRFPADFVFQLTPDEKDELVANCDHLSNLKFSTSLPNAFTEHGAIMVASVLSSPRAIELSVYVVRAFVHQREMLAANKEFAVKLADIERKLESHDSSIESIIEALRQLMAPPDEEKRRIGF